ncbi:magnesium/cobalt transporter CorA [Iamia sp. SCSIO 61187]|uniref:magnesium/cobalt transporter CorA n=1 Tax=Iamia sp. SCSIO 61187 TaxID=2722752 RepID=UPI001C62F112|nr:magnesium/cobalt transporter CorA [Iamia sp. SCSIO 61187]QYG92458.1 magnesium/cobalt transporter CorA [Iamia sp. SCSIO 61187]
MIVDQAVYRDGCRTAIDVDVSGIPPDGFSWIGLREPTPEEIDEVGVECGLHELLMEDVHKAHQRAKWDTFDEASLFVLKTAVYEPPDEVRIGEIQVVVGPRFVVTVRHGPTPDLGVVRRRLEANPDLLRHGPMAVLYALADLVVDAYAPVLSELETDIDEAEEAVFSDELRSNQAPRVYHLKRQVLELRRNIVPVGDLLADLCETDSHMVPEDLEEYFRDVVDHAQRISGRVELARELLTDALNANLAQQGVQQNEDMRKISAWAAVIATPTLLAGVWGMNFDHMPELDWQVGYPLAVASMAIVAGSLILYFRRAGWL